MEKQMTLEQDINEIRTELQLAWDGKTINGGSFDALRRVEEALIKLQSKVYSCKCKSGGRGPC
jgi:hypothetical protein